MNANLNVNQANRETIRQLCWNQALRCFGTAYIFERRANQLRRNLRWLTFLGIAVPASIGGIVLSFGTTDIALPVIIVVAGLLGIIQLILSIWSLVAKWDDVLAFATKSNSFNKTLSLRYKGLAELPPPDDETLKIHFQFLEDEYRRQDAEDETQGVTLEEKRMGMRAGLREFNRACSSCKQVPISMNATDCGVCGQF